MCGIVGYVGDRSAQEVVIEGLRRMEYRGYDSAGIALVRAGEGALAVDKRAGKLSNLEKSISEDPLPTSTTGIGHTRWATHGAPNDVNAHPHLGASRRVAVVHNGIIENFADLRARLEADDHVLLSETDTEVTAHLLELQVESGVDLTTAMQRVCQRLEGAFTLVAVDAHDPDRVVAARRNSPLVVGRGQGENFMASDVAAFVEHTRNALAIGQDEIVERIAEVFPLEQVPARGAAPADRWRYTDGGGLVGVVPTVTKPFCGDCDRVRMTADGQFRTCLFATTEFDLRALLRNGATDEELAAEVRRAVSTKWAGHNIGNVAFVRPRRTMSQIGG